MNYCDTQWAERHEAIALFKDNILPIIATLEQIMSDNKDDGSIGRSFHKKICDFEFIITLFTVNKLLALTYQVSVNLQKSNIDLCTAVESVENVQSVISEMRSIADSEFKEVFKSALNVANNLNVTKLIPRIVGTQNHRQNHSTDSPEVYFRISLFIPYLDELSMSLSNRFTKHKEVLLSLQHIVLFYAINSSYTNVLHAINFYQTDFEDNFNPSIIEGEWRLWKSKWKLFSLDSSNSIPKNAIEALKKCNRNEFPTMHVLLKILCIIPVTTASIERSFSTLGRLKTFLRNQQGNVRLSGLALMTIHRNIPINVEEIVNMFIKKIEK
ncbi:52 kDa repressor of the inhibitor of the protein kinase-like [Aphis gossypii]|uniref:52 kDa repressor of the inhibitor of the protein kinase-like n=1 Tax=Aphis gossypii TaxID=80765 RepID=UPI0021596C9B|nr:52 kDa repressor of the inhibitor of the protein kinase-like [Aphis gossypii]